MRILFVTPEPPHLMGGGAQRMYFILKYLSLQGHTIDLLTPLGKEGEKGLEPLRQYCRNIEFVSLSPTITDKIIKFVLLRAYFSLKVFKDKVREVLQKNEYDLIHVEKFQMAGYFKGVKDIPVVIDLWAGDLKGVLFEIRHSPSLMQKAILLNRLLRFWLTHGHYYRIFDHFLIVSREAKEHILKSYPDKNLMIAGQGMEDVEDNQFAEEAQPVVVFTGDMLFPPNIDTALYFAREIFPLVQKEVPKARFRIVGGRPPQEIKDLEKVNQNIEVTGFVDDIKASIKSAQVYVAPIQGGSGVRTKIIEAFSCCKPVVSTRNALEGIAAKDDEQVLIADEPEHFAQQTVRLLQDADLRRRIGQAGYILAKENYVWEKICKNVHHDYEEVVRKGVI